MGPRYSGGTRFRNPNYSNGRFNGNGRTAYNSATLNRSGFNSARNGAGRGAGLNQQRVVARHSADWNRHWDRGHDHYWHGHRCHFHNGSWFVYAPLFWYPYYGYGYGYDYYPYENYYSGQYYDDGSYSDTQAPDPYSKSTPAADAQYEGDSRISDIQSALAREGYYDGAIDGQMGAATRRALRRYQANHGLEATGTINHAVIEALQLRQARE
ncbi:MAG: peptidoglycan-binding protein [Chthoniobacterales bacterium]